MCHVYGRLFASSVVRPSFWQFMKARFARIYPLHLFTLVWAILLFAGVVWLSLPLDEREKSVFNRIGGPTTGYSLASGFDSGNGHFSALYLEWPLLDHQCQVDVAIIVVRC